MTRIGSLCSGVGALDLAALQLFPGSRVVWHCENDAAPAKVLAHHWPDVPNHHDITAIDWTQVEPVDVLTAGFPCQPFSAAGRRKGTSDERHLWPHVRNAIRVLRPRFALLENVSGHRSMGFDRVLGDCAEDGLHVRWTSIRASDVGACHHRERLFIMVTDGRQRFDDGAVGAQARSSGERDSAGSDRRASVPLTTLPTPRASGPNQHGSGGDLMLPSAVMRMLPTPLSKLADSGPDYGRSTRPGSGGNDLITALAVEPDWGAYEPAIRRQETLSRPAPPPTALNAKKNPRLSSRFAEWMMWFPDGWVTDPAIGLTRAEQLKAIGNGVVPPQAATAFRYLLNLQAVA